MSKEQHWFNKKFGSKEFGTVNFENNSYALYGRIKYQYGMKHDRLSKLLNKWKKPQPQMILSIYGSKYIGAAADRNVGEFVNAIYSIAHASGSWITTKGLCEGIFANDSLGRARKLMGDDSKNNCRLITFDNDDDNDSDDEDINAQDASLNGDNDDNDDIRDDNGINCLDEGSIN